MHHEVREFVMTDSHAGRYSNLKVRIIDHHNPDLVLLASDGRELMRVDMTRLSSTQSIHKLMQLLGLKERCQDSDGRCAAWSVAGECERNRDFMTQSCRMSCRRCTEGDEVVEGAPCHDVERRDSCEYWSTMGECTLNEAFMRVQCARACGFCQVPLQADATEEAGDRDEL